MYSVGVVLVNWNGGELTIPCIESLMAGVVAPDRIIVVDNASTDGSAELIAREFPQVEVVLSRDNLGFTGGNNIGIRKFIARGFDYIWVLNNDTVVERDCLKRFLEFVQEYDEVAGCCGKILYHDQRDVIWFAGATFNPLLLTAKHKGALQRDTGRYDRIERTAFITGCCMFVKKEAWEKVGMFDERFFAYGEDFDWCMRAKALDLQLFFVPEAVMYHKVSASMLKLRKTGSAGSTSPRVIYLVTRNRLYILRKHAKNRAQKTLAMVLFAFWITYYASALIILFRWYKIPPLLRGINDGMKDALV